MPFAQGTAQGIYLLPESSPGTLAGTVTADKVPVVAPSFRPERNEFQSAALTGSAEPRPVIPGKIGVTWDVRAGMQPVRPGPLDGEADGRPRE
jgi:hypothetical protein